MVKKPVPPRRHVEQPPPPEPVQPQPAPPPLQEPEPVPELQEPEAPAGSVPTTPAQATPSLPTRLHFRAPMDDDRKRFLLRTLQALPLTSTGADIGELVAAGLAELREDRVVLTAAGELLLETL